MQKETFCFSTAAFHLLQNCLELASMPYIGEVGATYWGQTDLLLDFLRICLFSKKLSGKVSNRSLLHS